MTEERYTLEHGSKNQIKDLLSTATGLDKVFRRTEAALFDYWAAQKEIRKLRKEDRKRGAEKQERELERYRKMLYQISRRGQLNKVSLNRIWRCGGKRENNGGHDHISNVNSGQINWEHFQRSAKLLVGDVEYAIARTKVKRYRTGERELRTLVKSFIGIKRTEPQITNKKFSKFLRIIMDDFNRQSLDCQLDLAKLKETWQNLERPDSEDTEASDEELLT